MQIWLAAAGAALLAVAGIYLRGRAEGAADEQSRQAARTVDAMRTRQEVSDEVAKADSDSVRADLSKWMRDRN